MERRCLFFWCIVFILNSVSVAASDLVTSGAVSYPGKTLSDASSSGNDTTGKKFRPPDPFPVEKQFRIESVDSANGLPDLRKNDVIRISTKNGLKHYRNKRLLNTYKIVPQLATITIQPQCRVAPCPPIDTNILVYHMSQAERFISIRNNMLLISGSQHKDANMPTTALRLTWKKACGLSSK